MSIACGGGSGDRGFMEGSHGFQGGTEGRSVLTCIKRHRNKRSSCIKRSVVKVPNLFPLDPIIFTSAKRSPLLSDRSHHLLSPNGMFSLSSTCIERSLKVETLKHKPTIIFQEMNNPFFSPKIKVSSIFEQDSVH